MELLGIIKLNESDVSVFQRLAAEPQLISLLLEKLDAEQLRKDEPPKTICIITKKAGPTIIIEDSISCLLGDSNTVSFYYYAPDGSDKILKLVSGKNLKTYEEWALNAGFFRCSQSSIVNLKHAVLNISTQCFELCVNGQMIHLPISRGYWKKYRNYLLSLPFLAKTEQR